MQSRSESLRTRAKQALSRPAQAIGLRAFMGASALLARVRARAPVPAQQAVQRFGAGMWARIRRSYPSLATLVDTAIANERAAARERATQQANPFSPPRQHVARIRGMPQDFRDLSALSRALRDPSAELAAAAAAALATPAQGDADYECRARLLEVLDNADGYFNPIVRVAALQSLRPRWIADGERADFAPLLRAVRDTDAEVSLAAIAAVADLAPPALAIDTLLPVVLDDTGFFLPFVQSAASTALERAGLLTKEPAPPS